MCKDSEKLGFRVTVSVRTIVEAMSRPIGDSAVTLADRLNTRFRQLYKGYGLTLVVDDCDQ